MSAKTLTETATEWMVRFVKSPEAQAIRDRHDSETVARRRELIDRLNDLQRRAQTRHQSAHSRLSPLRQAVRRTEAAHSEALKALLLAQSDESQRAAQLMDEADRLRSELFRTAPSALDEFAAELRQMLEHVPPVDVREVRHWMTGQLFTWSNEASRAARVDALFAGLQAVEAMRYEALTAEEVEDRCQAIREGLPAIQSTDDEWTHFGGALVSRGPRAERG